MKNQNEMLAMAATARVQELKANDQAVQSGQDTTGAREFAAGAEAGILWVLGHIGEIPFHPVEHRTPSGNRPNADMDETLANLPGIDS